MLAREEHWYSFASTGWLDPDWKWYGELYSRLSACGKPLGTLTLRPFPPRHVKYDRSVNDFIPLWEPYVTLSTVLMFAIEIS